MDIAGCRRAVNRISGFGPRISFGSRASVFGFLPPSGRIGPYMHDEKTVQRFIELRFLGRTYLLFKPSVSRSTKGKEKVKPHPKLHHFCLGLASILPRRSSRGGIASS